MKLPLAGEALVEREKIVDYLPNPRHRFGSSKARFFSSYGYTIEKWDEFAEALRKHGQENEVINVVETGFGPRYQVDGNMPSPGLRSPRICSVRQIDHGRLAPRLITAYPVEE